MRGGPPAGARDEPAWRADDASIGADADARARGPREWTRASLGQLTRCNGATTSAGGDHVTPRARSTLAARAARPAPAAASR